MNALILLPVIMGVVALILGITFLVGVFKVYKKAGKPQWAAIIPIYGQIVLLEIVGAPMWWIVLLILPGISYIVTLPAVVVGVLSFVSIITGILITHKLSKVFGQGIGFTIGLVVLPFIFYPILGFGKSAYQAPVNPVIA